jgi:putative membrane protein
MTLVLTRADRLRISDAIRAAEAHTSGEIYVVVARESALFRSVPLLWAALIALIVPWPLHLLTDWAIEPILFAQAIVFVFIAVLGSHHKIRYWLVPESIAAEASRTAAEAQFLAHGVHLTEERTGILIYVALANRRVEVVADAGINSKITQPDLDRLVKDVIDPARAGSLADGLIAAVNDAGALLRAHFPPRPDDRNELPDRVVEIWN